MQRARMAILLATMLIASMIVGTGIALAVTPTLTVVPASTTITVGQDTNASATISGYVAGDGSGTITIALFSDSGCTTPVGSVTQGFTPVSADGSFGPLSTPYTTTAPGSLYWQASYDGDDNNDAVNSTCVLVTVAQATPTATVIPADTTITVGDPTNATATLTGGLSPTGTMTIALFSDSACTTAVDSVTEGFTVPGTYGPLASDYITTAAGSLWWGASYDGDTNNAADSDCVEVTVAKEQPTLTTTPDPTTVDPAPGALGDTATLADGYSPTGTITFKLFPPLDATCVGTEVFSEDVTVNNGNDDYSTTGIGTGSNIAALAGVWHWTASYGGDTNNETVASLCADEAVAVYVDTFVTYAGQTFDSDGGGTSTLSTNLASIDPVCLTGDVTFTLTDAGGGTVGPFVVANVSPSTSVSTTQAIANGIYEVDVAFDPTNAYCNPSSDFAVLSVVGPGDAANGGGWYKNDDFSPPRINFGFTVQKQYNRKTDVTTYRGQLLWINSHTWRLKGTIFSVSPDPAAYGTFTCPAFVGSLGPPSSNPKCGSFMGTGVLQWFDPEANGGLGGWVDSAYDTVGFTVTVYDGGTISVCKGKKNCTKQDLADYFGIQIDPVPATEVPESAPIQIMKGSIKVS